LVFAGGAVEVFVEDVGVAGVAIRRGSEVSGLRWVGEPTTDDGVSERPFRLAREAGDVPGILWLPTEAEGALPLVMLGHGGSGHKRADRQVRLARWFAGEAGYAVVAIDGPYHGERVPEPVESSEYQQRMADTGVDVITDRMVGDWCATVDALGENVVDSSRLAYVGLSMGTRFGLPLAAALGNRLRCAVLGKYGMQQPASMPAAVNMAPRFTRDAPSVTAPVLFQVQWDDELFPRAGQFELFDLFGSPDNQLIAFSGSHATTPPAAIDAWRKFVTKHLTEGSPGGW
jgi:pimeloyl-ACP methyl ester carboxylesterase